MARRGQVEIQPGYQYGVDEELDLDKQNQAAQPSARVAEHAIGAEELVKEDVEGIATGADAWKGREVVLDRGTGATPAPGIYRSADFVAGIFTDGVITVGSTFFSSDSGLFSAADNGRLIAGIGILPGTYLTYVNATTVTLSAAAVLQYLDGVITGGTNLQSDTAVFSPADNGRVIVDTGGKIPAGTTITYVDPENVTLSQAATDGAAVIFQVNGRTQPNTQFTVVGRGRGWRVQVNKDGIGSGEFYLGAWGAQIAVGAFVVNRDGSMSLGYGATKFTANLAGDFTWGNGADSATLLHDGKFFVGATTYGDAIAKFDKSGNFTLLDVASAMHSIATGAVNPAVADVIASPAGGAITNPTNLSLNCQTKYSRIYYRSVGKDGVTNTDTSFVSATGAFTVKDLGKTIVGAGIPANTFIAAVTNPTTVVLSQATTATAATVEWYLVPDVTDTLYVDGTPLFLTATRKIAARAYKNGEYSAVTASIWLFDTAAGATNVQNPTWDPVPGSYSGSSLPVTLGCATPLASIFYTKTTNGSTPPDPTHDGSLNPTLTTVKVAIGTVLTFGTGTTKTKLLAAKAGLTDSGIVAGTHIVSTGSDGGGGSGGGGGGGGHSHL